MTTTARHPLATAAALLLAAAATAHAQPVITNLGVLTGGTYSIGRAVNSDGTIVAGTCGLPSGERAFRWTSAGGMQELGTLGGAYTNGNAISADGSKIAGMSYLPSGLPRAVQWHSGGIHDLGVLAGGNSSRAYGVRGDGLAVVGYGDDGTNDHAFLTVGGSLADLGVVPPSGTFSRAFCISGDGNVIAGACDEAPGAGARAMRWTNTGMVSLGTLPGGSGGGSGVNALSADGSVAVGSSSVTGGRIHAFRWTSAGGMVDLGVAPGATDSLAVSTSGSGAVIVGQGETAAGSRAWLWTSATGMVDLNTYLPTIGVALTGWTLTQAYGVSADGSAITGFGTLSGAARGWLVTGLPTAPCYANCDGSTTAPVLNVADFGCFLTRYAAAEAYANCDNSTTPPALNVADFGCFLTRYAAGCP